MKIFKNLRFTVKERCQQNGTTFSLDVWKPKKPEYKHRNSQRDAKYPLFSINNLIILIIVCGKFLLIK